MSSSPPPPPTDPAIVDVDTLLKRNQDADLLRFTTAGSVDDGKSTLIGRLLHDCKSIYEDQLEAVTADSKRLNRETIDLALVTDGLKSEREQGITIDVAYRYFSTPRRRFIISDTPGHEQYTRNMVTGASTAELAIVLIDARYGVLTQSKRHGFIASLLGIPNVVVCVNKMDLMEYHQSVFENICRDYAAFTSKLRVPNIVYIPVSALLGDNVVERSANMSWYDGPTLLQHLESVQTSSARNLVDFRFPVQLVNRPHQDFRGFLGSVASGVVRTGDTVTVLSSGQRSRVSRIVTFDGDIQEAFAGQSVTLCLADEVDISRGDMLAHPNNMPHQSRTVEAMLVWMHADKLEPGRRYLLKQTSQTVRAVITRLHYRVDPNTLHRDGNADTLNLNAIGRVTIECFKPLYWDPYNTNRATGAAVLIDPMTHATVGAVMIIERLVQPDPVQDDKTRNLRREPGLVSAGERRALMRQKPVTLWFTGLSGAGKSSIAQAVEQRLIALGHPAYVLDGDNLRHGLNRDLGFSAEDRTENIRRVAEVAALFNDAGLIAITAFISPYRDDRQRARERIGAERFIEVHVDTPLEICEQRDPKGLYRKARRGDMVDFTGLQSPYEEPLNPELRIDAGSSAVDACAELVIATLRERGIIPEAP